MIRLLATKAIGPLLGFSILVLLGAVLWLLMRRGQGSGSFFEKREADQIPLQKDKAAKSPQSLLAHAKLKRKPKKEDPALLTGINIDGPSHRVLGISEHATRDEIARAYRDLMKRYHPDKVGAEATSIAKALNQAKQEMLKKAKL